MKKIASNTWISEQTMGKYAPSEMKKIPVYGNDLIQTGISQGYFEILNKDVDINWADSKNLKRSIREEDFIFPTYPILTIKRVSCAALGISQGVVSKEWVMADPELEWSCDSELENDLTIQISQGFNNDASETYKQAVFQFKLPKGSSEGTVSGRNATIISSDSYLPDEDYPNIWGASDATIISGDTNIILTGYSSFDQTVSNQIFWWRCKYSMGADISNVAVLTQTNYYWDKITKTRFDYKLFEGKTSLDDNETNQESSYYLELNDFYGKYTAAYKYHTAYSSKINNVISPTVTMQGGISPIYDVADEYSASTWYIYYSIGTTLDNLEEIYSTTPNYPYYSDEIIGTEINAALKSSGLNGSTTQKRKYIHDTRNVDIFMYLSGNY